jgi:hypothetical protein
MSKLAIFAPAGAIAAMIAWLISPGSVGVSVVMALAATATAFSPIWFFIGTGNPMKCVLLDTLPRISLAIASAVMILNGAALIWYPTFLLLGAVIPPLVSLFLISANKSSWRRGHSRIFRTIRFQLVALGGRAASAVYISLPIAVVGLVQPAAVPMFAAVERLLRMALVVLQSIPNVLQSVLGGKKSVSDRRAMAVRMIWLNALCGFLCFVIFTVTAPLVSEFLFSGVVTIPTSLALLSGLVLWATVTSRASGGVALVALSDVRSVTRSAVAGCIVGLPSLFVLSYCLGAHGAVIGEIAAESVVLAIQLRAVKRKLESVAGFDAQSPLRRVYAQRSKKVSGPQWTRRVRRTEIRNDLLFISDPSGMGGWAYSEDGKLCFFYV